MFKNILVASDGSEHSDRAFGVAIHFARSLGSSLSIVTVVPSYPEYSFGTVPGSPLVVPEEEQVRFHREIATRLKERAESGGVKSVTCEVLEGHPGELILTESKTQNADLIVLGARGISRARRLLLGSVSHSVAIESTAPVLVVRGGASPKENQRTPTPDRIVVATDGSPSAGRALEAATELAKAVDVPLRIVTVVPSLLDEGLSPIILQRNEERLLKDAQTLVDHCRDLATQGGARDVLTEVLRGTPAESVLDYLGKGTSHLLVVGSRGRSRARVLLLGSVSTALLHHTPSMVMVVKASVHGARSADLANSRTPGPPSR